MSSGSHGAPSIGDVVIRHPKERKSKCSLQPLVGREDIRFLEARPGFTFDATGYILLRVDAPVISHEDAGYPLLLLDSTWRLLPKLEAALTGSPIPRSLPDCLKTAYPRVSKISSDPVRGLASVEAFYAARLLQGRPVQGLLDQYHWRDEFLRQFPVS
jgi:pre-rRNA-processing protein TSR3